MSTRPGSVLRMSYLAASVAGVAFFVLSVAWLGVWPARRLAEQARLTGPDHMLVLTDSERRGRAIYAREGCAYCHSQQVRFTDADIARFGPATEAWETRADIPQMMGTRRIGPDLSRVSGTRPEDWHLTHLYAPRTVVPASVMPAYRHLFDGAAGRPRQSARDLVAYIETLGRQRDLTWPGATASASVHPARARRSTDRPALPASGDEALGEQLFAGHCAACHGDTGTGDGPGAAALRPKPSNLALHAYAEDRLVEVLWNGVPGSAMPAWRDRSADELAALVAYLRKLSVPGVPANPLRVDTVRPTPEELDLGARVYAANCVQCHGTDGAGDGSAAADLPMPPTDFTRQTPMFDEALRVLRNGIDGTPMAPWTTRLRTDELTAVAHYVREFYYRGRR